MRVWTSVYKSTYFQKNSRQRFHCICNQHFLMLLVTPYIAITYLVIVGNVCRQESLLWSISTSLSTHLALVSTTDNTLVTLAKYVFTSDSIWWLYTAPNSGSPFRVCHCRERNPLHISAEKRNKIIVRSKDPTYKIITHYKTPPKNLSIIFKVNFLTKNISDIGIFPYRSNV